MQLLPSPREKLGGYVILPRLLVKVRLQARGQLPPVYERNLLSESPMTLDRKFLAFTGQDREELKRAILASESDESVLAWVEDHAKPHSSDDKRRWAESIESYRPDAARIQYRRELYPELAARVDVGALDVFDLIDMDEGRMPIPYRSYVL